MKDINSRFSLLKVLILLISLAPDRVQATSKTKADTIAVSKRGKIALASGVAGAGLIFLWWLIFKRTDSFKDNNGSENLISEFKSIAEEDSLAKITDIFAISQPAQLLSQQEIDVMLNNDLRSPKQNAFSCGAHAVGNCLTAFGISLDEKPLDPKKSFFENAKINTEIVKKLYVAAQKETLLKTKKRISLLENFLNQLKAPKTTKSSLAIPENLKLFLENLSPEADGFDIKNATKFTSKKFSWDQPDTLELQISNFKEQLQPWLEKEIQTNKNLIPSLTKKLSFLEYESLSEFRSAILKKFPDLTENFPLISFSQSGLNSATVDENFSDAILARVSNAKEAQDRNSDNLPRFSLADLKRTPELIEGFRKKFNDQPSKDTATVFQGGLTDPRLEVPILAKIRKNKSGAFILFKESNQHFITIVVKPDKTITVLDSLYSSGRGSISKNTEDLLKAYFFE